MSKFDVDDMPEAIFEKGKKQGALEELENVSKCKTEYRMRAYISKRLKELEEEGVLK